MKNCFRQYTPPIIWRYMLTGYTRFLCVALFGIISLLLTTKLEEVARFIALGAPSGKTVAFIIYQIPYMLQIAVPLSSLIAAFSLFSHMSSNGEITALRTTGYSLGSIVSPLSFFTLFLSIVMLWGVFDMSAKSRLASKKLEFDIREDEPLTFVQNSRYFFKHGIAMELNGSLRTGSSATDLLLCMPSHKNDRLSLIIIKQAHTKHNVLHGNHVSLISSNPPRTSQQFFGSLLVENADKKKTPITQVHELAQGKNWKVSPEQIPLSAVRAKQRTINQEITVCNHKNLSTKKQEKLLAKFQSEPYRRLSLSLAIFTLYLVGAISGIHTRRETRRISSLIRPLAGFAIFIGCYLAGKNLDEYALAATFFYGIPHPILIKLSMLQKNKLEHGME